MLGALLVTVVDGIARFPVTEVLVLADPSQIPEGTGFTVKPTSLWPAGLPDLATATTAVVSLSTTAPALTLSSTAPSSPALSSVSAPTSTTNIATVTFSSSRPADSSTALTLASTRDGAVPLSTNASTVPASDGVSKAALAGVAPACFLVGLVTAALLLWAIRSRRRRHRPNRFLGSATPVVAGSSEDSSQQGHKYLPMTPVSAKPIDKALPLVLGPAARGQEKALDPVVAPVAPSQAAATTYPPSSFAIKRKRVSATSTSALTGRSVDVSDRTFSELRTQVKTILEQLDMHVDNFYTEASALPLTEDYMHNLQQLDSPYLPDSIIGLLPEVSGDKIKPLIKHCLAYAIFSRIGGSSTRTDTDDILLPDGLAAMTHAIQPSPTLRAINPETYEQHIDRLLMWKHETTAMMDAHAVVKSANMQSKISKLAWKCVKGLEPWSLARYGAEAKKSHLARAIDEAVELGLRVFGEKQGWLVWQWEQDPIDAREGAKIGDFVLFPGLELRRELSNGRTGAMADRESDRNVGGTESSRKVVLAATMASI